MPLDLKSRLSALGARTPVTDPIGEGKDATLATLRERIERISARKPTLRPKSYDQVSSRSIAKLVDGEEIAEGVVVVDRFVPLDAWHGRCRLSEIAQAPLQMLSNTSPPLESLLFLDTETSGLAGGTGTVAFLVGLARMEGTQVHLRQVLLTAFKGETDQLVDAQSWIANAHSLVTFNGKSFDIPLLATRYRLAQLADPFIDKGHIDLLHPVRAAYGKVWTDAKLQTAEKRLLKLHRDDDIPGHLIPEAWSRLLRQGDGEGMKAIMQHNFLDVLSMVALLAVVANTYAVPGMEDTNAHGVARAHLRQGRQEHAIQHLAQSFSALDGRAMGELARLHGRRGEWPQAVQIWEHLAGEGDASALESLAKYHEHVTREFTIALDYARRLLREDENCAAHSARVQRLERKRRAA